MFGHSPDKAGRSEVGSAVGERRSEVGGRSEVRPAPDRPPTDFENILT